MPKINVYLPGALADAVRDAQVPGSAIRQAALERAVRDVTAARAADGPLPTTARPVCSPASPLGPARPTTLAQEAARAVPHNYVGTEHLLLGVLDEGGNVALPCSPRSSRPGRLRAEFAGSMPGPTTRVEGHLPFTPRVRPPSSSRPRKPCRWHNYVGCEHLLLACSRSDAIASKVLRRMGSSSGPPAWPSPARSSSSSPVPAGGTGSPTSTDDVLARILERLEAIERRLAG